jgi:hypothetical protein
MAEPRATLAKGNICAGFRGSPVAPPLVAKAAPADANFIGGEEALLTLDLVHAGWYVVYAQQLLAHHHPSPQRDRKDRHRIVARNAIWVVWLRLSWITAMRTSLRMLRYALAQGVLLSTVRSVLQETPWLLRNRRVISAKVHGCYKLLN